MRKFTLAILISLFMIATLFSPAGATVTVQTTRNVYTGTGTVGPFPYQFKIWTATDLEVIKTLVSTGAETVLTLNTHYTVSGVGVAAGGNVTLTSVLPSGYTLTIRRKMPLTQSQNYVSGQAFPAAASNNVLDKLQHQIQQVNEKADRAVQLPRNTALATPYLIPSPGNPIRWNLTGTGLEAVPSSSLAQGSFLQSGTGAVTRTAQAKMGEIISAKDFGAKGDGVSDDTAALQASLAATPAGGKWYLPGGDYVVVAGNLAVTTAAHLFGNGRILTAAVDAAILDIQADNVTIDGLTLESTATFTAYAAYGSGAVASNLIKNTVAASNVFIRNCTFTGGYTGVRPIYGGTNWTIENCTFNGQKFCGIVAEIDSFQIRGNRFSSIGTDTTDTTFHAGGHASACHAVYVAVSATNTVKDVIISENGFSDVTGSAVAVASNSAAADIVGPSIINNKFRRVANAANLTVGGTRLKPCIEIAVSDATSTLRGATVIGNQFLEAAALPVGADTLDWYQRMLVLTDGNVSDLVFSNNVAIEGSGYLIGVFGNDKSSTARLHDFIAEGNILHFSTTELPASKTTTYGAVFVGGYNNTGWILANNLISGANMVARAPMVKGAISGNTFSNIGANATDAIAYFSFLSGSTGNRFTNNMFSRSTGNAKRCIWFNTGANGNTVGTGNEWDSGWSDFYDGTIYNQGGGNLVEEISLTRTISLATPGTSFNLYYPPTNMSFIVDQLTARADTDITATDGDYWGFGVDAGNRRVDFGVSTNAAATSRHAKNSKIRWLNSPDKACQIVDSGEFLKLISVNGNTDAAAKSNNIGGADQTITVRLKGKLVGDLEDL